MPDPSGWDITILGTDINPLFLRKAMQGAYRDWSFRSTPEWIKQRYFTASEKGSYTILPKFTQQVKFNYLNLANDIYPSTGNDTEQIDIILCRNVLMYFEPEQAKRVIGKLYRSLSDKGWLILSAAESGLAMNVGFEQVSFPNTVFYRKQELTSMPVLDFRPIEEPIEPLWISQIETEVDHDQHVADMPEPSPLQPAIVDISEKAPLARYEAALEHYQQGAYEKTVRLLLTAVRHDAETALLLARAYANQGQLSDACHWCEAAIDIDKCHVGLHYLHALIQEEQGRLDDAAASLKKSLYLDHDFVLAHFTLGSLYRRQGKHAEADRCFSNASKLLCDYQADEIVPESEGITVGQLIDIIRSKKALA